MNHHVKIAAVLILAAFAGGCAGFRDISLFSTQEEIELGMGVAQQVESEMKLLDDPQVVGYVRTVGSRVAAHAERQDIEYVFNVVDAPDQINAFAIPGGWVYIFTGLLKQMQTEAELAAVLAHEVAHIAERHSMEQLTRQFGFNLVLSAVLGEEAAAWQAILAQASSGLVMLRFSRDDERQADELGVQYMYAAGYNPEGMVHLLELFLSMQEREPSKVEQWLSTHPISSERIRLVKEQIEEQDLQTTGTVERQAYQNMIRRLR